jgi:hypothetical protein
MHDYAIRIMKDDQTTASAFWSLTLYDLAQGFFIPNERKKRSVDDNAGMKLSEDGGIKTFTAA